MGNFFFYGETYISLNISIDGIQPSCKYRLGATEDLMIFVLDFHFLNSSKTLGELGVFYGFLDPAHTCF